MLPDEAAETLQVTIDGTVLLFAAALSRRHRPAVRAVPGAAQHAARSAVDAQGPGRAAVGGARAAQRFRTSLATAQIALSMALLVCAGLFTKSLLNVSRVDLGINVDNVVTFGVSPELNGYTPERSRQLFERLEERARGAAGRHRRHARRSCRLLGGSNWGNDVAVRGLQAGPGHRQQLALQRGRPGLLQDAGHAAARRARVHARRRARRAEGRDRQRGVREEVQPRDATRSASAWATTGGPASSTSRSSASCKDAKYSEVKDAIPPLFFRPYRQDERVGSMTFYVRTAGAPEQILADDPARRGAASIRTCRSRT